MWSAHRASLAVILVPLGLVACSTENDGGGTGGGATATGTGGNGGSSTSTSASSSSGLGEGGAGGGGGAAAAVPTPEECEAFTDEESCLGAGCSLYERFYNLRVDEEGTCRYGDEFHMCVVWPHTGVAVGGGLITGYYRMKDGVRQDIEAGALYAGGLPGWNECDAEDPVDGACACAGQVQE